MNWTEIKPTEPGYYWYRVDARDDSPMILYVGPWPVLPLHGRGRLIAQIDTDRVVSRCGSSEAIPLTVFGEVVDGALRPGEWSGPIQPPADPE